MSESFNWLALKTKPDLSFDALRLSMNLNYANYSDAKSSKKVVMKAKQEKVAIKYSKIGKIEDLHIEIFADASLGNVEKHDQTKSVMGMFLALKGADKAISPLHWKAKVIDKVAQDIKSAETLALENAVDDAIHLADMISEVYTGESQPNIQIPLVINEDSKALIESLHSTKKVKRKTMRVVISSLQQLMKSGRIQSIHHVKSNDQLADVFTKKGVCSDLILDTVSSGTMNIDRTSI